MCDVVIISGEGGVDIVITVKDLFKLGLLAIIILAGPAIVSCKCKDCYKLSSTKCMIAHGRIKTTTSFESVNGLTDR